VPLERNNTGLILLGASEFPESENFEGDTAFAEAKDRILNYFIDKKGPVSLEDKLILDLFNRRI